jgi:hypothetical protein
MILPAYDDIASLHLNDGVWRLRYAFRATPLVAGIKQAESMILDMARTSLAARSAKSRKVQEFHNAVCRIVKCGILDKLGNCG